MKSTRIALLSVAIAVLTAASSSAKDRNYELKSPDGTISVKVCAGSAITYSVSEDGQELISPSPISMTLSDGTVYGKDDAVRKAAKRTVKDAIPAPFYKKSEVIENYNELSLTFKEFSLVFRAYDQGIAYRFISARTDSFTVESEQATFNFAGDWNAYIPYVRDFKGEIETQFMNSFENTCVRTKISQWEKNRLCFLPLTIEAAGGVRLSITESDLLDYPGMYLLNTEGGSSLSGVFAPYPKDIEQGGHNMLQGVVKTRENYIAKASGKTSFPWRIVVVADEDKDLANTDLTWLLGTPSQGDFSWVKPGKVAWDWWNDWNLYNVDFRAGINNDTYRYYIDFASANGIEYVILDEGWAVNMKADLLQVIPEINLEELSAYAQSKGVGLILWAGYWAINRDIEGLCKHFSEMGIKGFKIDFMDRDDQMITKFYSTVAETAARYHLIVDFHGAFKPIGLQRTFPNVLNHEGVQGLEQMKWGDGVDQMEYELTIPFTRMVAGPLDYTQGAMRNATKVNYRPVNTEPMSQGTRCHQLAEYVIFESPLNMLCDSPSNYLAERECLDFIAAIPTVWDETVAIDGKIAQHISIARRKGDTWYVGALTNWDARDMVLDLGFLGQGNWKMDIYEDGVNADRAARDYRKKTVTVPSDGKVQIHMAPGGGWAAKIYR